MHRTLANATFRIECGNSSGSGFSFRNDQIAVTNFHVIQPHTVGQGNIYAITDDGQRIPAIVLSSSPAEALDFAILQLLDELPAGRHVLQPDVNPLEWGEKVIFAGFPHGIHHLLVHEAIVSGPFPPVGFYLDGSINGGNSGGPIISARTGNVAGVVTKRRFPGGGNLQALSEEIRDIERRASFMAGQGARAAFAGIDLGEMIRLMSGGLRVMSEIVNLNANSGIGIGFDIGHVNRAYDECKLP